MKNVLAVLVLCLSFGFGMAGADQIKIEDGQLFISAGWHATRVKVTPDAARLATEANIAEAYSHPGLPVAVTGPLLAKTPVDVFHYQKSFRGVQYDSQKAVIGMASKPVKASVEFFTFPIFWFGMIVSFFVGIGMRKWQRANGGIFALCTLATGAISGNIIVCAALVLAFGSINLGNVLFYEKIRPFFRNAIFCALMATAAGVVYYPLIVSVL